MGDCGRGIDSAGTTGGEAALVESVEEQLGHSAVLVAGWCRVLHTSNIHGAPAHLFYKWQSDQQLDPSGHDRIVTVIPQGKNYRMAGSGAGVVFPGRTDGIN
ncbi:hypothetical protein D3C75_876040 [compost metagenome]